MHPSIRLEGSILSADILDAIERGERAHQSPKDFGLDPGTKVKDEIADAWAAARAYWAAYQTKISRLKEGATGTTETRNQWMVPLFGLLGYQLSLAESESIQGKNYRISHRDTVRDHLPVHIIGWHESLDRRSTVPNAPRMSPHGLVQEYLNLTEHLYGIITNGRLIRLLRDSTRLVKLTFIEFDLERIFTEELFADFALLYRLLHATRLPVRQDAVSEAAIEIYHQDSLDSGSRIRDGLSAAVQSVILSLANGFLNHPDNNSLSELARGKWRVASGGKEEASGELQAASSGDAQSSSDHSPLTTYHSLADGTPSSPFAPFFYSTLLRLIYRLLFLMVIEERGLVHAPGTDKRLREIYDEGYSLARLRRLAEKSHFADARHQDAWLALVALFRLVDESGRGLKLGVAPLGGDLFGSDSLGPLENCHLDNATFLGALRQLTLFTNPSTRQLMRVNYGALNVEEFGSVYQGLLEFEPRITEIDGKLHFSFAQGDERAATGSHYTPDELVQPLIRHSLDHLIEARLEEARRVASSEWRAVSEEHQQHFKQAIYGILSRPGSVAERDGFGAIRLRVDEILSERGIVWPDQPNSQGGGLRPGQRGGGVGTQEQQGLPAIPQSGKRQSEGIGNPSLARPTGGTDQGGKHPLDAGSCISPGSSDAGPAPLIGEKTSLRMASGEQRVASGREEASGEWRAASGGEASSKASSPHHPSSFILQPSLSHSLSNSLLAHLWTSFPLAARHSLLASQGLLALRVSDISCGSGHILLAAARRIGLALAIIRTGDDQPSPAALREATRDVIKNCIYGVDLNPLAVELCKVALWLEAHVPGEPLGFLDHHIKCGNAIVGFVRREELDKGVPDEAFKPLPGDDKETAAKFRKRNKEERQDAKAGQKTLALSPDLQAKLDAVLDQWRKVSALPESTPAEIAEKKRKFQNASTENAFLLRQIAAIPIAQFYTPKTPENEKLIITDRDFRHYLAGRSLQDQPTHHAWATAERKRAFHWFLEFPDIIANGGFDCILGNPPYLGGQALSGTYGHAFCEYVRWQFAPTGLSDLVVFFVRRIYTLLRPNGFTAFITTNSIKDGDVRKDGLEQVIAAGGSINMAVRGIRWPGVANLVVSLVSVHHGEWAGPRSLDGKAVQTINAFFEDAEDGGDPLDLQENADKVFQGSIFLGDGFLLTHQEAASLIAQNPKNAEVISALINGQEINNNPDQAPGRSIINFRDWPMEKAREYAEPFEIVKNKVKTERLANARVAKLPWWQYERIRSELYLGISTAPRCFAAARTTKHLSFSASPTQRVFSDALYVFTTDRWDHFAVVQSTIHEVWARKYSGALETRLRYSPSDCFETFAFPAGQWQHPNTALAALGERYHEHRRDLMLRLWLGLTDIYNLFHAPELEQRLEALFKKRAASSEWRAAVPEEHRDKAGSLTLDEAIAGIQRLRDLHVELDGAVLAAYGWAEKASGEQQVASGGEEKASGEWRVASSEKDHVGSSSKLHPSSFIPQPSSSHSPLTTYHSPEILLQHDFYSVETLPENDRIRYTISPEARKELLKRLLALNHQRAAEEGGGGTGGSANPANDPKPKSPRGPKPKAPQREKKPDELI